MAGSANSAPTPWWQLQQGQINSHIPGVDIANGNADGANALTSLDTKSPPGYAFDKIKGSYAPIIGSPTDELAQRSRTQGIEDKVLNHELYPPSDNASGVASAAQQTAENARRSGAASSPNGSVAGLRSASGADPTSNWDTQQQAGVDEQRAHSQAIADSEHATAAGVEANRASMQGIINALKNNGLLTPPRQATYGTPDTSAAQASVFAAGKDRAAQVANSSLTGLSSALASRGLGGAGYEAGQVGKIAGTAEGAVSAANRDTTQMALDATTHAADQNFQGQELTQEEAAAQQAALLGQVGAAGRIPRPASLTGLSSSARAY